MTDILRCNNCGETFPVVEGTLCSFCNSPNTYDPHKVVEYRVQQRLEDGWETVTVAVTREEAIANVNDYRTNQPQYPVRWRKHFEDDPD